MNQELSEYFMGQAILEGRKAREICGDNPPVGCVLVSGNKIVARGYTNEPGKPHAEAMALAQLPVGLEEIVAFVTLEPCSFHGRTPSCAQALVERGVSKLFVGILDPDPRNNGVGIDIVKKSGVEVVVGTLEKEILQEIGSLLNSQSQ